MNLVAGLPEPVVLVAGLALIVACGCAGIAAILGVSTAGDERRRRRTTAVPRTREGRGRGAGMAVASLDCAARRRDACRLAVGVTTQIWLLSVAPRR